MSEPQRQQPHPDVTVRLGGWLFRHRTSIPVPVALALLLIPARPQASDYLIPAGILLVAAGEALRLWAVRHIGAISRTRSDRLGPVVATGPFAHVRNPLYVGNVALWTGFALAARLPWAAAIVAALVGFEYHAIVRWEERLLESNRGADYRAYLARVPRWIPTLGAPAGAMSAPFSWRDTLFSERGTLVAIAAGFALLASKSALW
ncbi:MAG: methyltransferase family protein [Betaproteobacteria bacterium]